MNSSLAGIWGIDGAVVVELDGNGRPDFATVGNSPGVPPNGELNVFLQDGNGAFHLTRNLPMSFPVTRVAAGDLNADGRNDLILLGKDDQVLVVLQSVAVPVSAPAPYCDP